eukprot:7968833-Lingulodinium_polyedra.AAC.1
MASTPQTWPTPPKRTAAVLTPSVGIRQLFAIGSGQPGLTAPPVPAVRLERRFRGRRAPPEASGLHSADSVRRGNAR